MGLVWAWPEVERWAKETGRLGERSSQKLTSHELVFARQRW
jgi:hypothetical protein